MKKSQPNNPKEKHRLKITPIDYVLLLFIGFAALIFFFFFYRETEKITIRVKVTDRDVIYARTQPLSWFANRFQVGDVEKDSLGRISAEIINVESFETSKPDESGLSYFSNFSTITRKVVYVDILTKAVYDSRTQTHSIKGANLAFGAPVRFNFSNIQFDGIVTEVNNNQDLYETKTVKVESKLLQPSREYSDIYGVLPEIANAVKVGDKILDSNANVLARIEEVKVTPAKRTVITDSGQAREILDPVLRDVTYTIHLRTKVFQNEYYVFDDIPVKIGSVLPLNFHHISVFPTITKLLSLDFDIEGNK